MSQQRWREVFIAQSAKEGLPLEAARRLLRKAATLTRLAEAQCNGDWPADNGKREVKECPRCATYWVPSTILKTGCPDCRAEDNVRQILKAYADGWTFTTQGDPRGCPITLKAPTGKEINVP